DVGHRCQAFECSDELDFDPVRHGSTEAGLDLQERVVETGSGFRREGVSGAHPAFLPDFLRRRKAARTSATACGPSIKSPRSASAMLRASAVFRPATCAS